MLAVVPVAAEGSGAGIVRRGICQLPTNQNADGTSHDRQRSASRGRRRGLHLQPTAAALSPAAQRRRLLRRHPLRDRRRRRHLPRTLSFRLLSH